ncbi:hypothetical protein BDV12DRAFT_206121 [Aspergillus spectabilis]
MEPRHLKPYPRLSSSLLRQDLSGKTILITGGGYGVGSSIATSFAEASVRVIILVGRTETKLKSSAENLSSSYKEVSVVYITADISSKSDVNRVFETLRARDITPDILVNNAGYLSTRGSFIEADLDEYWESFNTNVLGTILVTQGFLKHRRATLTPTPPQPAVVITLNTIGAYTVHVAGLSAYGASKAALSRWSELISDDIPATEARFVSVHPGYVKTDMAAKSRLEGVFEPTDARLAGDFVAWLAGDEAGFLGGRFVWVNWDVEELVNKKEEIVERDLLRGGLVF